MLRGVLSHFTAGFPDMPGAELALTYVCETPHRACTAQERLLALMF